MSSTDLLAAGGVTHVPGVYDPATAALAVRAGHRAAYLSGEAIAATMLGAFTGTVSATQIADRAAVLAPSLGGVPLLADAGVGFETPDDAVWTALAYQRSGIGGLVLGDGSALRAAAVKQRAPGVLVIASAAGDSLGEAVARCRELAAAGADAVLPVGLRESDLRSLHAALPGVRLAVSRTEGASRGRLLSDPELVAAGVGVVLHPLTAALAALRAASVAYHALAPDSPALRSAPPAPPAGPDVPAAGPGTPRPAAVPADSGPAGPPTDEVDLMPPAVLAALAGRPPLSFLPRTDESAAFARPPLPAPAVPAFGDPAFGAGDDRPWAVPDEPAERPWAAISRPSDLPQPAVARPERAAAGAVAPAQRTAGAPTAGRPDRTWASIAQQVSRLGT
ncbi:hypothetical protein Ade02nite_70410 [Paractinoplanes deccanensis]|uniref:Methylisocitrate lyase n=1 Tax=Paractinoplanes deccanensis TaxID=113561 RepID=A0ABQ3YEP5_9ACTN|nr:isocitrate lyase/phosphoenolpyruvate mutase family protein [Actinoplanes deccanensis]GID78400.1 hypothetical protein Ade02nite_70410 [Actinoplanes deccanensis]